MKAAFLSGKGNNQKTEKESAIVKEVSQTPDQGT
jgi:hypothetical protein